jgi:ATP-dependent Clp protease ATP-binding subunit ClpA
MNMNKMTEKMQEIISDANSIALNNNNGEISPYHFFSAAIKAQGTLFPPLI